MGEGEEGGKRGEKGGREGGREGGCIHDYLRSGREGERGVGVRECGSGGGAWGWSQGGKGRVEA